MTHVFKLFRTVFEQAQLTEVQASRAASGAQAAMQSACEKISEMQQMSDNERQTEAAAGIAGNETTRERDVSRRERRGWRQQITVKGDDE